MSLIIQYLGPFQALLFILISSDPLVNTLGPIYFIHHILPSFSYGQPWCYLEAKMLRKACSFASIHHFFTPVVAAYLLSFLLHVMSVSADTVLDAERTSTPSVPRQAPLATETRANLQECGRACRHKKNILAKIPITMFMVPSAFHVWSFDQCPPGAWGWVP